ncbi:hypothetical protein HELRODRAFT_167693 [Helobdella robusta]|uniref:Uncharacterized protein n=1 Tax=Helobdella robusta TaxID=6412 RepID=T1EZP3_HELRO|nr:hypothetical protein HELRODRAFT_167693 [Helobdella robusta]ESO09875.1 hypothetical protein HELRODRAFT_167693 [Helobdella robusta]
MRLVLALAAYYKPNAVRPSHSHRMPTAGYAHSASTALAEAHEHASTVIKKPSRPSFIDNNWRTPQSISKDSSDNLQKQNGLESDETQQRDLIYALANLSQEHNNLLYVHDEVLKELNETKCLAQQLFITMSGSEDGSCTSNSFLDGTTKVDGQLGESSLSKTFHNMHRLLDELELHHQRTDCRNNYEHQEAKSWNRLRIRMITEIKDDRREGAFRNRFL